MKENEETTSAGNKANQSTDSPHAGRPHHRDRQPWGQQTPLPGPADAHGAPRLAEGRLAAAVCGGGAGLQPAITHS